MKQKQVCWMIINKNYNNKYFGIIAIREQKDLRKH